MRKSRISIFAQVGKSKGDIPHQEGGSSIAPPPWHAPTEFLERGHEYDSLAVESGLLPGVTIP
jgi:hypothetical protein